MEKISTPRSSALPRVANLATVAVLGCATWWSGAQRPDLPSVNANVQMVVSSSAVTAQAAPPLQRSVAVSQVHAGRSGQPAHWPANANLVRRDGVQPVGFQQRHN